MAERDRVIEGALKNAEALISVARLELRLENSKRTVLDLLRDAAIEIRVAEEQIKNG